MKKRPVILIGGGGHAKVLLEVMKLMKLEILGYTDKVETKNINIPYLGDDNKIAEFSPKDIFLVNGLGIISVSEGRMNVFNYFKSEGYEFITLIHPSAILASTASIGEGVQIMAGVIIQPQTVIGDNSILNTKASVDHDCIVGANVHIAPGVTISGSVRIGDGTHIGTGASIIQGIKIGKSALVGAGATVIRNVEDQMTVMGVPAKEVKADGQMAKSHSSSKYKSN